MGRRSSKWPIWSLGFIGLEWLQKVRGWSERVPEMNTEVRV